jgi:hypothetical protein
VVENSQDGVEVPPNWPIGCFYVYYPSGHIQKPLIASLVACTAVRYKNQSRGHSELNVSLEYWKKSEVLWVII